MVDKLGPCSQGAQYYFRTVNGRQQKVVCPKYRWQQRQEQHLQTQEYLTEREAFVQKRKRSKAVTALVKMAPAIGVIGGVAVGRQAFKMGALPRYDVYKKVYGEYRKGKEVRTMVSKATGEKVKAVGKAFFHRMKPLGRFNAAFRALKDIAKYR